MDVLPLIAVSAFFGALGAFMLVLPRTPLFAIRARARREELQRINARPFIAELGAALGLQFELSPCLARGIVGGFGLTVEPSGNGTRFCVRGLPPGLSLSAPRESDGARTGDPVLDTLARLHGDLPSWRARLDVATRMALVRVMMSRRGLTVWDGVLQWVSREPIGSVDEGRAAVSELVDLAGRLQLAEGEISARLRSVATTDPLAGVRSTCVQELGTMPLTSDERHAIWAAASKDGEPSVRLAALAHAPSAVDAEELLLGIAGAEDDDAWSRALVWLARNGTARSLPALVRVAERGAGPRARSAREVARAIEARLGQESRGRLSAPEALSGSGALSDPPERAGQVTIVART